MAGTRDTTVTLGDRVVHRMGFGALRLTAFRPNGSHSESVRVARRAVELGIDFIDTADCYSLGANEELLAEALHPYPDDLVVATKVGLTQPSPDEWVAVGRPAYLRQQVELSLRRLRTDCIDLLQLHRVDPEVPLADQVGVLRQMQEEGKARHLGLSEVTVEQLEEARRHVDVVSVQNLYNLDDLGHHDVLEHCAREGLAFIPWEPFAGGSALGSSAIHDTLTTVAEETQATPAQVSLAWLLHRSPAILLIPGTSSTTHLEENAAAVDLDLTPNQLARLSRDVGAAD